MGNYMSWAAGDEAALPLPPQCSKHYENALWEALPLSKEIDLSQKNLTVEREERGSPSFTRMGAFLRIQTACVSTPTTSPCGRAPTPWAFPQTLVGCSISRSHPKPPPPLLPADPWAVTPGFCWQRVWQHPCSQGLWSFTPNWNWQWNLGCLALLLSPQGNGDKALCCSVPQLSQL